MASCCLGLLATLYLPSQCRFFLEACEVPELEGYFDVDSYSEVTQLTPPTVTLTAAELQDTHKLLLEFREEIAPDPKDPLHVLLQDLGPAPTLQELLGDTSESPNLTALAKVKVSLTLSSKFSEAEQDTPESDYLLRCDSVTQFTYGSFP